MNTHEILAFCIPSIFAIIGFLTIFFARREDNKFLGGIMMLVSCGMFAVMAILNSLEAEKAMKQCNGKCPEYEKVENVYKLKP